MELTFWLGKIDKKRIPKRINKEMSEMGKQRVKASHLTLPGGCSGWVGREELSEEVPFKARSESPPTIRPFLLAQGPQLLLPGLAQRPLMSPLLHTLLQAALHTSAQLASTAPWWRASRRPGSVKNAGRPAAGVSAPESCPGRLGGTRCLLLPFSVFPSEGGFSIAVANGCELDGLTQGEIILLQYWRSEL